MDLLRSRRADLGGLAQRFPTWRSARNAGFSRQSFSLSASYAKHFMTLPAKAGGTGNREFQQRYPAGYLPAAYSADAGANPPRSRTIARRCLRAPGLGAGGCVGARGCRLEILAAQLAHRSAVFHPHRHGRSEVSYRRARRHALEAGRVLQTNYASAFDADLFPARAQHDQRGSEVQTPRADANACYRPVSPLIARHGVSGRGIACCAAHCVDA